MSYRRVIYVAALAALGIACVSADALVARAASRAGATTVRGGAVTARGGTVATRGAIAYRGDARGYRGGIYGGDYYRPDFGAATGALVGGAITASSPWYGYGGYGYGGYGYSNYYGPNYASSYGSGYSNDRYIDSRTKTYYDDYCKQRFKSYDSSSGTYLGDDGLRYTCP